MPELQKTNDAASFPVALYEAYDDLPESLHWRSTGTGRRIEDVAAMIRREQYAKGTYELPGHAQKVFRLGARRDERRPPRTRQP